MCIYTLCGYDCITRNEHHSRYARMRKNKVESIKFRLGMDEEPTRSSKVNWNMVKELGLDKPIVRNKTNISTYYNKEVIV